jgi:CMP-N-acetylneuraminic acid synthetase/spore coat polysaccharide biosynthesis predicted glycosyltransferase SpsG
MSILAIIPARGGSKGVKRKAIRYLNGKPLIYYTLETIKKSKYVIDNIFTCEDEEINYIAKLLGYNVLKRYKCLSNPLVTLDPVIYNAFQSYQKKSEIDIVITLQPTSPCLTYRTLDKAIDYFIQNKLDTLISVRNDKHLSYPRSISERKNRQELQDHFRETGGFVITKKEFITEKSRFGYRIDSFELPEDDAIDIDTKNDLILCENILKRKNIVIRTIGNQTVGLGHIYRAISLYLMLNNYNVEIVVQDGHNLGMEKLKENSIPYTIDFKFDNSKIVDILINDKLDTINSDIEFCKAKKIINFEDNGIQNCDVLINDLYDKDGYKYFLPRPEFLLSKPYKFKQKVQNILILFGGTDPKNYTDILYKISKMEEFINIEFTFILGLGYKGNVEGFRNVKNISEYMKKSDLAVSSCGRTLFELAMMRVPTIALSQNLRELKHSFEYGVKKLGITKDIDLIKNNLIELINNNKLRKKMYDEMSKLDFSKNIKNILRKIEE